MSKESHTEKPNLFKIDKKDKFFGQLSNGLRLLKYRTDIMSDNIYL